MTGGAIAVNHDAIALCSETIRAHSKSFAMASRLLPQPARNEAVVLYAWCRRADDAIDEAPPGTASAALDELEQELEGVYAGQAQADPVLSAFQALVVGCRIPAHYPKELLAGMRMDVEEYRYRTRRDLLLYCYRVASVVGLMMCHVMGVRRPEALLNAAHLGAAMQLTNICRDVVEDWERGRFYLPESEVQAQEPTFTPPRQVQEPFPDTAISGIGQVVGSILAWADVFYDSGDRGVINLKWRSALAIISARKIYADIGRVIRRRNCDVSAGRAFTTKGRKIVLVLASIGLLGLSIPIRIGLALAGRGSFTRPDKILAFEDMLMETEP